MEGSSVMENKTDKWEGLVEGGQGHSAADVVFFALVFGGCCVGLIGFLIVLVLRPLLGF